MTTPPAAPLLCRAACVQLTSTDDLHANMVQVERWVRAAAAQGAEFITLPENTFYLDSRGLPPPEHRLPTAQHPGVQLCQSLARELGTHILIGSLGVPCADPEGRLANRSVLIDATGSITAIYDKLHLYDVTLHDGQRFAESRRFAPGSDAVLAATPWGPLGMTICYDLRFPYLFRSLAQAGAVMLTVPAAFTRLTGEVHWHTLLRARAIETFSFVLAAAQTGSHPGGRETYGHALIVSPWGEVLADAGTEPGIIVATLDIAHAHACRASIPSLAADKPVRITASAREP